MSAADLHTRHKPACNLCQINGAVEATEMANLNIASRPGTN